MCIAYGNLKFDPSKSSFMGSDSDEIILEFIRLSSVYF
jgi:hypothetical protein